MPMPDAGRLGEYARKGAHALLREVSLAPEQVSSLRLRSDEPAGGPRVMVVTPRSWAYHVQVEAILGHALRLRGATVEYLVCGTGLPVCDRANTWEAPPMPCRTCHGYVEGSLRRHGLPFRRMEWTEGTGSPDVWPELDEMTLDELEDLEWDGIPLGRLTAVPTRWFLMRADLEDEPLAPRTRRDLLVGAREVARAARSEIERFSPDVVVALNGLFFFESIVRYVAQRDGIDVVTYERAFEPESLVFRRELPASHYDITPLWERWREVELVPAEEARLDDYLESRRRKGHPIFDFWKDAVDEEVSAPLGGRLVVVMTNVTWDSAVIGRERAYPSIQRWLEATVRLAERRPQDRFVIRIHPAEVKMSGKTTREPLGEHLARTFDQLPPNIRVVLPDDPTSSYVFMEACDLGLVLTSTVGLEMALMGKPVVVAGDVHYRGKGFTLDADSPETWEDMVVAALEDPRAHAPDVERARRYAHAFFFRAPIDLPQVSEPVPGLAAITVGSVDELRPGVHEGLDRICDGILGGGDFMPDGL